MSAQRWDALVFYEDLMVPCHSFSFGVVKAAPARGPPKSFKTPSMYRRAILDGWLRLQEFLQSFEEVLYGYWLREMASRLGGHDVMVLAEHFLQKFARENQRRIDGFSEAARAKVLSHSWPGNVRELENAMERAVVLSEGALVEAEALPFDRLPFGFDDILIPGASLAEIERHAITKTLQAVGGSTGRAAEILDISLRTIQYRIQQYGSPENAKPSVAD